MFDLGVFTLPVLAAVGVFGFALLFGEDIVIEKIDVPYQLQWNGYTSVVATRQFVDELRELNEGAASELIELEVDPTSIQEGLAAFEDYFELSAVINGSRQVLGLIPYYVEGEISDVGGEQILHIRVFTEDEKNPVFITSIKGDPNNLEPMMKEAAVNVMERINPYLVALYYRQKELKEGQFDFKKTQESAERFKLSQPLDKHYLIYGLLGRMHMLKAQRDMDLTPEQKQAEYNEALKNLNAATRLHDDFLFPWINRGIIYAEQGQLDLAEQNFARAVSINPNYMIARTAWGDLLAREGRWQEAAVQYVAAVEISRERPELRDKLARAYLALGRPDLAREQWEEALNISPMTEAYLTAVRDLDAGKAPAAENKGR